MKRLTSLWGSAAGYVVLILGFSSVGLSKTPVVKPTTECQKIHAFSIDPDPKGLNLRTGPSSQQTIIEKLPPSPEEEGPPLDIIGSTGSWLYIDMPGYLGQDMSLRGWVYGPLMATRTQRSASVQLLKDPQVKSIVLMQIPPNSLVKFSTCQKEWIQVEYNQQKGWIHHDSQCYFYGCK